MTRMACAAPAGLEVHFAGVCLMLAVRVDAWSCQRTRTCPAAEGGTDCQAAGLTHTSAPFWMRETMNTLQPFMACEQEGDTVFQFCSQPGRRSQRCEASLLRTVCMPTPSKLLGSPVIEPVPAEIRGVLNSFGEFGVCASCRGKLITPGKGFMSNVRHQNGHVTREDAR